MAILAQFGNLKFEIAETSALLFQKLKITAECETEEQTNDGMKHASYKNGKAAQITLTAIIESGLGADVKGRVKEIMGLAQQGSAGYFYAGGEKLAPCQFTLTKAATEEIRVGPTGKWTSANVNLTLTQCTKEKFSDAAASTPSGGNAGGVGGWNSGAMWGETSPPSKAPSGDTAANDTPPQEPWTASKVDSIINGAKKASIAGAVTAGALTGIISKKKKKG